MSFDIQLGTAIKWCAVVLSRRAHPANPVIGSAAPCISKGQYNRQKTKKVRNVTSCDFIGFDAAQHFQLLCQSALPQNFEA